MKIKHYIIKGNLRDGGIVHDIEQVLQPVYEDVPPGIVSFMVHEGGSSFYKLIARQLRLLDTETYEEWASKRIKSGAKIHTIKDYTGEWSVGEHVTICDHDNNRYDRAEILGWKYECGMWCGNTERGSCSTNTFEKIPNRYDGGKIKRFTSDEAGLWANPNLKFASPLSKRVERIEKFLENYPSFKK